ncbi:MAG: hypothetical protein ABWY12_20100 [Burkholderiales bacterium]
MRWRLEARGHASKPPQVADVLALQLVTSLRCELLKLHHARIGSGELRASVAQLAAQLRPDLSDHAGSCRDNPRGDSDPPRG